MLAESVRPPLVNPEDPAILLWAVAFIIIWLLLWLDLRDPDRWR